MSSGEQNTLENLTAEEARTLRAELKQRRDKAKIIEILDLEPELYEVSICPHESNGNTFHTATVGKKRYGDQTDVHELLGRYQNRILSVPRFEYGGFLPSWMSEDVNFSSRKPNSKRLENEHVLMLREHGSDKFRDLQLSFWIHDIDVGFIDVHLKIPNLPWSWRVIANYGGYDFQSGEVLVKKIVSPAGIKGGLLRTHVGGHGSWDYTRLWATLGEFFDDIDKTRS